MENTSHIVTKVTKRDGTIVRYNKEKIYQAINKAWAANGTDISYTRIDTIVDDVDSYIHNQNCDTIAVEEIQDIVERTLISHNLYEIAKSYILYRKMRDNVRTIRSTENEIVGKYISKPAEDMDDKRENANVDGNNTMGIMLKIAGMVTKKYTQLNLRNPEHVKMHEEGRIHEHDLDFSSLCANCIQIPLNKLLDHGFNTGHGSIRQPATIQSASTLTCIAIQSSQNDCFGGQAIPLLDFYLAPYVAKSFVRNSLKCISILMMWDYDDLKKDFIHRIDNVIMKRRGIMDKEGKGIIIEEFIDTFKNDVDVIVDKFCMSIADFFIYRIFDQARDMTISDCNQAMEGLVHNLCSLASRAGGQVPFSSVNFGQDTSIEGQMVTDALLNAIDNGLGSGETAIFPIAVMQLKKGVTDNDSPNYRLFKKACKVSAKRLFPNFVNLDAPFNLKYYDKNRPETFAATMGCRTRVIGNCYDPTREIWPGRGNIFPVTLNLPFVALEADEMMNKQYGDACDSEKVLEKFYSLLEIQMNAIFDLMRDRFEILARRKVKNYPFLMGQGLYLDSDKLGPEDEIRSAIKHGTLTVGFIGLAETLVVLTGKHHGESEESQKLGLQIVKFMHDMCVKESHKYKMNYSLMGSPAEGSCGRLLRLTRKRFGIITGVTDHEYLTNSSHVPVYYNISAFKKIDIEAPYHEYCPAGHIGYVELDGDTSKNIAAFESVVNYMANAGMGYFSINHPVDRDPVCGYTGIIGEVCPRCGRREGEGVSREKLLSLLAYQPDPKYDARRAYEREECIETTVNTVDLDMKK